MKIILAAFAFIWLVSAVAQLYYWLVMFMRIGGHRDRLGEAPRQAVSVVICTHRPTPELPELLNDLSHQSFSQFEVIVVNDGPNPDVSRIIRTAAETNPAIREVAFESSEKTNQGKKEPLQAGIRAAKHDWILVTDADCRVSEHWIHRMIVQASAQKRIVLGVGPLGKGRGFADAFARFDNLLISIQYLGFALSRKPYMGVGRNMLYDKALFDKATMASHAHLISGDDDLFVQQAATSRNTTVCLDPDSFAWSNPPGSWGAFIRQKRRHTSTAHAYKAASKRALIVYGSSFVFFWLGLVPVLLSGETGLTMIGIVSALLVWAVFGNAAGRLKQTSQVLLFPIYAIMYAFYLCLVGWFTQQKPPKTWN